MSPMQPTGTVTWSANTGCACEHVSGAYPGVATCTTSSASHLPVGTDTVTATYSGDSNHTRQLWLVNQSCTGGIATTIDVTNVSPSSEDFGCGYTGDDHGSVVVDRTWRSADGERHHHWRQRERHLLCDQLRGSCPAKPSLARRLILRRMRMWRAPTTETAAFSGDTNYAAIDQSGNRQLHDRRRTSTHGVTLGPESIDLRTVGDIHGDGQRATPADRERRSWQERDSSDAADGNGDLECEHGMRVRARCRAVIREWRPVRPQVWQADSDTVTGELLG